MSRVIFLDAGPLGMVANPKGEAEALRCQAWARAFLGTDVAVVIPEIADFEVRRELIRKGAGPSLSRLDRLKVGFDYAAITTDVMLLAAELWADVRQRGLPTAGPDSLDGDCILAALALSASQSGDVVTVATTNVDHLNRFTGLDARRWDEIEP